MNTFTGGTMAATVDTNEGQLNQGGRCLVKAVRPIIDGGVPSVAIGYRNRNMDTLTYTTPVAMDDMGKVDVRIDARFVGGRITIPAGSAWTHLSGLDVDWMARGKK